MADTKPVYIQLDSNDDVVAVRDRLSFIRGRRVLLIWPEKGSALKRKLDLVLIQREAKRRAIQIAFITHDPQIIQHSKELGISTFETIEASETSRWSRGRTRVFIQRFHKPADEPEPDALMEVASRVKNPPRRLPRLLSLLLRLIILAVLISAIGGAIYAAVPYATIVVQLDQEIITAETKITADTGASVVDVERGVIPATRLQAIVETSGTISTSGTQQLSDVLATGVITITNQTNQSVTVPANTVVSTSAGTPILFTTTEAIIVPAGVGQRAEVAIQALQSSSGDAGNVETGLINTVIGPLDTQITVRNLSPTSGGQTRSVMTVTKEDRERLLGIVRGQLQALAFTQMEASLTDNQFIIIETIGIAEERDDWTIFSHREGDISDTLTLNMRAVVEAIAIDDRLGQQIALARLSALIPRGKRLQPNSIQYTRGAVETVEDTKVIFNASSQGVVIGQLNTLDLQEKLAGKSLSEAYQILANEANIVNANQAQITIWPDYFPQLPLIPIRITIQTVTDT